MMFGIVQLVPMVTKIPTVVPPGISAKQFTREANDGTTVDNCICKSIGWPCVGMLPDTIEAVAVAAITMN